MDEHHIEDGCEHIDENLRELYDNWFIETCEPWVVPYLGELLRVRSIKDLGTGSSSTRAYVDQPLRYSRRKGTIAVIEELARDVTNWQARAGEFFLQLDWTQHLNHVRSSHHRCPDLRDVGRLRRIDGPFDSVAHTVDVLIRLVQAECQLKLQPLGLRLQDQGHAIERDMDAGLSGV